MKSISAARPTEAIAHMTKVIRAMNAGRGVRAPGLRRRQARWVSTRFSVTSQVLATTTVRPT